MTANSRVSYNCLLFSLPFPFLRWENGRSRLRRRGWGTQFAILWLFPRTTGHSAPSSPWYSLKACFLPSEFLLDFIETDFRLSKVSVWQACLLTHLCSRQRGTPSSLFRRAFNFKSMLKLDVNGRWCCWEAGVAGGSPGLSFCCLLFPRDPVSCFETFNSKIKLSQKDDTLKRTETGKADSFLRDGVLPSFLDGLISTFKSPHRLLCLFSKFPFLTYDPHLCEKQDSFLAPLSNSLSATTKEKRGKNKLRYDQNWEHI